MKTQTPAVIEFTPQNPFQLLRVRDITKMLGISRSSWFAWVKSGKAPQPLRLSPRASCWRLTDIAEFLERVGNAKTNVDIGT